MCGFPTFIIYMFYSKFCKLMQGDVRIWNTLIWHLFIGFNLRWNSVTSKIPSLHDIQYNKDMRVRTDNFDGNPAAKHFFGSFCTSLGYDIKMLQYTFLRYGNKQTNSNFSLQIQSKIPTSRMRRTTDMVLYTESHDCFFIRERIPQY